LLNAGGSIQLSSDDRRPWKSTDAVEWETFKWVDWFNNHRLLEPIGYITPTEAEEAFYANMNTFDKVA
jgi:putative transposase